MRNGKHVILYVDDDDDDRLAVRQMLDAAGYEMVEASDGEEGLRVLKKTDPDLVLLDLMMEEVDAGVSLLKQIRARDKAIPVYLLSSVGETLSTTTSVAELGFSGVLQKPVDTATLSAVIKARLGS